MSFWRGRSFRASCRIGSLLAFSVAGVAVCFAAGARWLAPGVLTPVLVGDTAVVADSLRTIVDLETA